MVGSIRWNFIAGCVGFVTTFLASITSNILTTTLLRSLYSALILFAIVFVLRFILGIALAEGGQPGKPAAPDSAKEGAEALKGQHFDFTTPDVDQVSNLVDPASGQALSGQAEETGFTPLNPPKLKTKKELDSQDLVQAIRHLSED